MRQAITLTLPFMMQPITNGENGEPKEIEVSDISNLCVRLQGVGETGQGKKIGLSGETRYEIDGSNIVLHIASLDDYGYAKAIVSGKYGQVCLRAEVSLLSGTEGETSFSLPAYVFKVVDNSTAAATIVVESVEDLKRAIAELPDGQAVSVKVAEHTVALSKLHILTVDEMDTLGNYCTSLADLSEKYSLINLTWTGESGTVVCASILPSTDSEHGWLYEFQEGWRVCKMNEYEFYPENDFLDLASYMDGHSTRIATKAETGEPSDLTTEDKSSIVAAVNEVSGKVGDLTSKVTELDGEIDNKLVLTQMDICYGRAITRDGTSDVKRRVGRGATSYIPCKGAKTLKYRNIVTIDAGAAADTGLAFYDRDKVFISFVPGVRSTTSGYRDDVIDVPSNAHFFRASYWNYDYAVKDTTRAYGEFYAELSSADIIRDGKRASSNDYVYFSAKVNQSPDKWWETGSDESKHSKDINVTNGVLLLPPTYSMTGEKTKVIINFHGYSHKVSHDYWGNQDGTHDGFLIQKQRWANAGYAVMDCNNELYSLNINQSGLGSLQSMNAYRACWEWVKANYNVDDRPFIVCGSAGGPTGINCCYNWGDVRAAVWLDCWTTMARCWELDSIMVAELYGLSDSETYDYEKLRNYDPTKNVFEVGGVNYALAPKCPTKVLWISETFAGTLIGALKDHQIGGVVDVRKVTGINHSDLVSGGDGTNPNSAYIDDEIIAWCDSH